MLWGDGSGSYISLKLVWLCFTKSYGKVLLELQDNVYSVVLWGFFRPLKEDLTEEA